MTGNIPNNKKVWWFIKYKVYHIPFWGLLFYLWAVAVYDSVSKATETLFFSPKGLQYVFIVTIHTCAVFFCLYYLVPKYLLKGRLYRFVVYCVLWILFVSALLVGSYFVSSQIIGVPIDYYHYFTGGRSLTNFFTTQALPSTAGAILLGLSIKLTKNNLQNQRKQELLEKEKLETELRFLRYQFNPHFLFNTINSIFFLIKKHPDKASTSLAKFSELLRYQLYESNEDFIPFSKEINYVENFIALERLRKKQQLKVTIDRDFECHKDHLIAPFILMTFVENAFKHVSNEKRTNHWIKVSFAIENHDTLEFRVANSTFANDSKKVIASSGIGLANVKRRLNLLYPSTHTIEIKNENAVYSVYLSLKLKKTADHAPGKTVFKGF